MQKNEAETWDRIVKNSCVWICGYVLWLRGFSINSVHYSSLLALGKTLNKASDGLQPRWFVNEFESFVRCLSRRNKSCQSTVNGKWFPPWELLVVKTAQTRHHNWEIIQKFRGPSCLVPFKGAVVIPQDDVEDGPVEQRLHLDLQKTSDRTEDVI